MILTRAQLAELLHVDADMLQQCISNGDLPEPNVAGVWDAAELISSLWSIAQQREEDAWDLMMGEDA